MKEKRICKYEGCNKEITIYSKSGFCRSCSQKGENNYFYTDGGTITKHFCIEPNCDNEICYRTWKSGKQRCVACGIKKQAESKRGDKCYNWIDGRTNATHYCIEPDCDNEICYKNWKEGNGRCYSCAGKFKWADPVFHNKTMTAILKSSEEKPNIPEKFLMDFLEKILPKMYDYVGNGKFWVDRFNPDFVNKKDKRIIELFGDYWHNLEDAKKRDVNRLRIYSKCGYKTLVIWQKELDNLSELKNKILCFNKK